jgi:branched-chain amino acid transport system ATP-binding protein
MVMLQIKNIKKAFGERTVLDSLSLDINKGKVYTLIGSNGSGKTTLLNIITGFIKPESGSIRLNGKKIISKKPYNISKMGLSRTFQDLRLIKNLTVKENIILSFTNNSSENIFKAIMPYSSRKFLSSSLSNKADEILDTVSLLDEKDKPAGEISFGQQKLLTLGCCLAADSNMLLLDEPVAGIDSDNYKKIKNIISKLKSAGKTILQIEHNVDFIESVSDEILFLNKGKISHFSSYGDFTANELVRQTYQ